MHSVPAETVLAGRYRLRRRLGAGGMSEVWLAYDRVLERQVAIKLLTGTAPDTDRVAAEARAVARLTHPHIVTVFDYAEAAGPDGTVLPFVVMEYVPGRSLAARLDDGPLPWPYAVTVAADVARALAAAHAAGIVHRDVTAANVLLGESGVKVVDFGISAAIGAADTVSGANSVAGTPAYLSPERLAGLPVEPASDVYSLGVLLHLMLSGQVPFGGATAADVARAHWFGPPAPLPSIAGLPAEVDRLRRHCLAKRAKDRPTAAELAAALPPLVPPPAPEAATPPSKPTPRAEPATGTEPPARTEPATGTEPPARTEPVAGTEPVVGASELAVEGGRPGDGRSVRWVALVVAVAAVLAATAAATVAAWPDSTSPPVRHVQAGPPHASTAGTPTTVGSATTTPSASATPSRTPSAPPRTTAAAACSVAWTYQSRQPEGYTATLVLSSTAARDGWTLTFRLPPGQRVTTGWNGRFEQHGTHVTVYAAEWNARLDGHGVQIGFNATATHDTGPGTGFAVNGTRCTG